MNRRALPIFSADDAAEAIRSFASIAEESTEILMRISQARFWYAVKDTSGHWAFAPAKWAGFQKMTPNQYLDQNDGIDGRRTEKRLGEWFEFLEPDTRAHTDLLQELNKFLGKYGKQSSSACRIALLKGEQKTIAPTDDLVELIIRILERLDGNQRNQVRRALSSKSSSTGLPA
jgi:hypothetical protein